MKVQVVIIPQTGSIQDYVRFDSQGQCLWCLKNTAHGYDFGISHQWHCITCAIKYRAVEGEPYWNTDAERVLALLKKYLEENPEFALEE